MGAKLKDNHTTQGENNMIRMATAACTMLTGVLVATAVGANGSDRLSAEDTLRERMPAHIAEQIREMGRVIDPPGTFAMYANEPRRFGPDDVDVSDEIAYGPHARHRLQVYVGRERDPSTPAPVILLVHGGGFVGGSLNSFVDGATHFAGLGFTVVNMTYPLAPENRFPAGPEAVGLAMNWTRDNIADHGGDPARIFVLGASAGATHVANYVFMPSLLPDGTAEPAGAILYSPNFVVDFDNPQAASVYYGDDIDAIRDMLVVPGNIERTSIPVLTTVAELDPPVFHQSAARLYHELINDHGVLTRLRQLSGHNHISVQASIGTDDTIFVEEVLDFILTTDSGSR
jgi:acetyl esterase/lipase